MFEACSIPACAAPFLYWRGGRLFRYDVKAPSEPCLDVPDQICQLKPICGSVFVWLRETCCSSLTLRFALHAGLAVVRLRSREPHGSVIRPTEAQEP
jgi:hypothetical protein